MISSLKAEINVPEGVRLNVNMSSLLHGYIMENVDSNFAGEMHISEIRPFSQSLNRNSDGKWIWRVNTLTEKAEECIINVIKNRDSIYIKHHNVKVDITSFSVTKAFPEMWLERNTISNRDRYINMEFITPTAFKSKGRYVNYPDIRLLFMSIINKYNKNTKKILNEEIAEEIINSSEIYKYDLKSTYFSLEGVRIPSFWGRMTIKINGNSVIVNTANMLAEFAQYSGVGIKCALGMGGVVKDQVRSKGEI